MKSVSKATVPAWLLFFFTVSMLACKKNVVEEPGIYQAEKDWIHQNGGAYKNESMLFRSGDGTVTKASLDWSKTNRYTVAGITYTEVPFALANPGGLSFSLVLKTSTGKTEATIKLIQANAKLKGANDERTGTLETYSNLEGGWISTTFKDGQTGRLMKRAALPSNNIPGTNGSAIKKPLIIAPPDCYIYFIDVYGWNCWADPLPNGDYNVTCGWEFEGTDIYIFCFENP